jgi:hypothetical protein
MKVNSDEDGLGLDWKAHFPNLERLTLCMFLPVDPHSSNDNKAAKYMSPEFTDTLTGSNPLGVKVLNLSVWMEESIIITTWTWSSQWEPYPLLSPPRLHSLAA